MPKLKTHSGAKDRVKVTKNGKVLHGRATRNHFLQNKSAAQKRRLAVNTTMSGKSAKNVKLMLGSK